MELGLTIPLQRHLKIRDIPYGEESGLDFCWDLHVITLNGRASLLAVHCTSRYTFALFDLNWLEWNSLAEVFLDGLHSTFQSIGISGKVTANYLRQAGALQLTKTHGRREVAYLNRAWEDVLAFDYALDHSTRKQPLLNRAVNLGGTSLRSSSQVRDFCLHLFYLHILCCADTIDAKLSQRLTLSWPTILQNVKELLEMGLVQETGQYDRSRMWEYRKRPASLSTIPGKDTPTPRTVSSVHALSIMLRPLPQ